MSGLGCAVVGVSSIWAPACQETSHVGNAGVGVVSLKGALHFFALFCYCSVSTFFLTVVGLLGAYSLLVVAGS